MDKYSRKVYKFLKSQPQYGFQTALYDPEPFAKMDFIRACEYLVSCGYAKKSSHGYALTHAGIHKRELEIREFLRNFFTRYLFGFVSGIAASVAASILTKIVLSSWGI